MAKTGKKADDLKGMKACYKEAKDKGDRGEEARWANQIGHAYKDRGDYVDALAWFRLDYDISVKRQNEGPSLNLMPSCQSLGETYYRLGEYKEALHYQERHLELAVESNNLAEQQRAYTQLGRTYMEMLDLNDDVLALPKAKKYLGKAKDLATKLKDKPPPGSMSFVNELIDAYNNLGSLKMIIDEPLEARGLLMRGLKICDEEEVGECDATRTRVHHNLGRLYAEKRQWSLAMVHIVKDIEICKALPHPQGEVKGLINLGDIHFKQHQYEDSMKCYHLALGIARKLQDEDTLTKIVETNKEIVEAAIPKLAVFNEHLAKHKKMQKLVEAARGTPTERNLNSQEFKFLKELIGKAFELQHWEEHLKLAKRLKKVVTALGDKEKLGDALDVVGESYNSLCNYEKARKWHLKSFNVCKRVGHKEGQAVALVNYGNSLDSSRDYKGALKAYKQAYDIIKQSGDSRYRRLKLNALNNMHYCYVVRFDNTSDARRVETEINRLKELKEVNEIEEDSDDVCSETDDEVEKGAETQVMDVEEVLPRACTLSPDSTLSTRIGDPEKNSADRTGVARRSPQSDIRKRSRTVVSDEDSEESAGPALLSPPKRKFTRPSAKSASPPKVHPSSGQKTKRSDNETLYLSSDDNDSLESMRRACKAAARKKPTPPKHSRLTKDKDIQHEDVNSPGNSTVRNSRSARGSGGVQRSPERNNMQDDGNRLLDRGNASLRKHKDCNDESQPEDLEERGGNLTQVNLTQAPLIIPVNINGQSLRVIIRRCETETNRTVGWLTEEIIRLYTCDSSVAKKPVVQRLEFKGIILKPVQIIEEVLIDLTSGDSVDAIIQGIKDYFKAFKELKFENWEGIGWVTIPVVERYEAHCIADSTSVNPALALKLRLLKGSYEEVDASNCDLQDVSVRPLIAALQENDALSSLNLSHNLLGNSTMNAIQEMIAVTNQSDLGLTLDLHMNQLGAGALMQIAKCHVTLSRLEVLKLSGNRLTDAAGRNLAIILAQSRALATLEIERCGLTTRSIQQISSSLQPDSSLVKLCIGHNNPIGGSALSILFQKLSGLLSFTELDLCGIELDEKGVLAATSLLKSSSSLSILNMAGCEIQNHGAQVMCRALMGTNVQLLNIDMSSCGWNRDAAIEVCQQMASIRGLSTLNLSYNQLNEQATEVLSLALRQGGWRLKSLSLNNCCIGQTGVLHLLQSLQGNSVLWELHLAGNFELDGTRLEAVTAIPEHEPVDIGNHATEQIQVALDPTLNGGPQADLTDLENHRSDPALKGLECGLHPAAEADVEQHPITVSPSDSYPQGVAQNTNLQDCQQAEPPAFDRHHVHFDVLNETTQLNDDFFCSCEQPKAGEVPVSDPEVNEPLIEEVNEPLMEEVNEPVIEEVNEPVIEELVVRIIMARGLQCLNLAGNGLSTKGLKRLSEAWCIGGRTVKGGFVGKAHFVVQDGRECSALMTSCVNCQLGAGLTVETSMSY